MKHMKVPVTYPIDMEAYMKDSVTALWKLREQWIRLYSCKKTGMNKVSHLTDRQKPQPNSRAELSNMTELGSAQELPQ